MGRNTTASRLDKTSFFHNLFSGIFFLTILFLFCRIAAGSAIPVEVGVQANSLFIEKGQEFKINISIDPNTNPISGAQFSLVFNKSLAKIKNISEGNLLKINGAKTLFNYVVPKNRTGNRINVWGLIITPGESVAKENNLTQITFISNATGTFRLELTNVIICNPESISLKTNISNLSLNIINRSDIIHDVIPPQSIRSLKNVTYDPYSIKWTWTDPMDPDFSEVIIYFNGKYNKSVTKGTRYFNATGLDPHAAYTISLRSVDAAGNINSTWVNHTARTAPAPIGIVFFDDMETGTKNWDASGLWHITARDSASSNRVFWYGQESSGNYDTVSDGAHTRNHGYLTSREISLVGVTNPALSFMMSSQVEPYDPENYDKMRVQLSEDKGITWVDLLELPDTNMIWDLEEIDLSQYTGEIIKIRFSFSTLDGLYNDYEGLYIDDVKIYQSS